MVSIIAHNTPKNTPKISQNCPKRVMFACLERRTFLPYPLPAMQYVHHGETRQHSVPMACREEVMAILLKARTVATEER